MPTCHYCNHDVAYSAEICPKCGARVSASHRTASGGKSRLLKNITIASGAIGAAAGFYMVGYLGFVSVGIPGLIICGLLGAGVGIVVGTVAGLVIGAIALVIRLLIRLGGAGNP